MFFFFSFFFFFRFFSFFFVSFSFSLSAGVVPLGSLLGSVSSVAFGSVWSLGSLLGSFLWGPCGFSPGFWSAFGCFGPCFWLCGSCRVGLWGRSGCLLLGPAFGSCFGVRLFGPRLLGLALGSGSLGLALWSFFGVLLWGPALWSFFGVLLFGPSLGSFFWVRLFGPRLFGWSFGFGLAPVFGSRLLVWSFGFGWLRFWCWVLVWSSGLVWCWAFGWLRLFWLAPALLVFGRFFPPVSCVCRGLVFGLFFF